jgi:hypothetical protein
MKNRHSSDPCRIFVVSQMCSRRSRPEDASKSAVNGDHWTDYTSPVCDASVITGLDVDRMSHTFTVQSADPVARRFAFYLLKSTELMSLECAYSILDAD